MRFYKIYDKNNKLIAQYETNDPLFDTPLLHDSDYIVMAEEKSSTDISSDEALAIISQIKKNQDIIFEKAKSNQEAQLKKNR